MAYSTTAININRGTTGVVLPQQLSQEIWANAVKDSAVMQLAQRVDLPGSGLTIPVITGDPTADFVAESTEKHVSNSTFGFKQMTPYKVAVIELFSNEFKRDLEAVYAELARRLPYAIAKKFDETVLHGTAPGTNFSVLTAATAVAIGGTGTYGKLVTARNTVANQGYLLNGWAMAPQGEGMLIAAVDGNSNPLFPSALEGNISSIFGAPVVVNSAAYAAGTPNVVGVAGDWSQARYGIVDGINIAISEEATVNDGTNQINLWQRNMFAVRAEAEVGFVVKDANAFIRLTDATS